MQFLKSLKQQKNDLYLQLKEDSQRIKTLVKDKKFLALTALLQESLHRTVGELNDAHLYMQASSNQKKQISIYLSVIETALNTLCDQDVPHLSQVEKRALFAKAEKNFGRPALMLSGGGTFGIYHIGVVATLIKQQVLPNIISGTSMGAITAGMLASHKDNEIISLLKTPEISNYAPLKMLSIADIFNQQSLLDPAQLSRCIEHNVGNLTFEEAFQRTGREVSITVSPARMGQKPRILNYQTSPNVLISSAAKASCSIPGLFPQCTLLEKNSNGKIQAYMKHEKWVDGSFATDIPRQRISRLHNVNYFIVSQTNPHILPFITQRQKNGVLATLKDFAVTSAFSQGAAFLKVARRRLDSEPWRSWFNHAAMLLDQDYSGDINIHPNFPISWYLKFMKNPSPAERDFLLDMGELSALPHIEVIRNQTRVSLTLQRCIDRIDAILLTESRPTKSML
jgi:predicted acylesterase/phospholipase RssA